jgi:hypothetical protein
MIRIPAPTLQLFDDRTPYASAQCQKMGKGRVFHDVVVLKGTFDLAPGKLRRSERQADVVLSDRYHDEEDASRSSLAWPGDLVVGKPATDVIVTGTARAPGQRAARQWECTVRVLRSGRTLVESTMVATGPRAYTHRALRGFRLSDPEPALEVPIRYELAYGGSYPHPKPTDDMPFLVDEANPCGRGFFDESKFDTGASYPGPQWQTRGSPPSAINTPSPLAGFGPVARMWSARTAFGGTYDAAWEARLREDVENGLPPDYPADFDMRFFQCAHPSLVAPAPLRSGDIVQLLGLAEAADLSFVLPSAPGAELLSESRELSKEPLALDLVHVDLDAEKVFLSWRISLPETRAIAALRTTTSED